MTKSVPWDSKTGYDPANEVRSITVEIAAPARIVWQILLDMPKYGEWNPFCVKAESTLEMGAPVHMQLTNFWNDELAPNCEYICAFEPEKLISWEMKWTEAWPYAARRDQVIEATGPDSCSYYSTDAFYGDTGVHVMRFAGGWVKASFDATAKALKARAEALWAAEKAGK
jgi:hypothetical protein